MPGFGNDPMNRGGMGAPQQGNRSPGGPGGFQPEAGAWGDASTMLRNFQGQQAWNVANQPPPEPGLNMYSLRMRCLQGDGNACNQLQAMQQGQQGPGGMGGGNQMGSMLGSMYGAQQQRGMPGLGMPGRGAGQGVRQRGGY